MGSSGSTGGRFLPGSDTRRAGQSGKSPNPSGLSREARKIIGELKDEARSVLAQRAPGGSGGRNRLRSLLRKLYDLGMAGDVSAIRELLNRAYGQAPQSVDADVRGGVTIKFEYCDAEPMADADGD